LRRSTASGRGNLRGAGNGNCGSEKDLPKIRNHAKEPSIFI